MKSEEIILGKKYTCQPIGLKHPVVGEVINKLENCIVLCIEKYQVHDHEEILEKCGKVVVKYENVYGLAEEVYFEASQKVYEPVFVL
ncbi:hypothetical protein [Enterococcus ratti]|uniref:Uncharacterized protein n=1 Tax=Enterococcus ratti TaxID=150033 RepID=A0A1L8WCW0_9ENTE|nr:hypothetical protein [Enterococcus ratti]OJG78853.1 hypothetical protein RV14_GL001114 [Enterococcus ratti]